MQSVLNRMLKQLSEEDKAIFESLSDKLKAIDGDFSKLSTEDRKLIAEMESKYAEKIKAAHQQETEAATEVASNLLNLPFAQHVRQILARDLGDKFPLEEDAVAFVFENKWLPLDCQDPALVNELFTRFEQDISEANQWREDLLAVDADKKMAVGLAWFMVIFQFHKRLSEGS
ncbi:hypothetical protein ACUR5C_06235 [Aliikangiella sp. IMCC44653]